MEYDKSVMTEVIGNWRKGQENQLRRKTLEITDLELIHKKDGSFKIRVYDSDKYLVRMYNDGFDTLATAESKNVMMPSLKVNKDNALIDFPINGYRIEDVDGLIKSLTDMTDLMKTLKELRKEIES